MKIIKKNWTPEIDVEDRWWVGRYADCGFCGSTIQFEDDDYVSRRMVYREHGMECEGVYALCPVCNQHGIVEYRR